MDQDLAAVAPSRRTTALQLFPSACVRLSCSPKNPRRSGMLWDAGPLLEASHRLHEMIPALWSTAMQPLRCTTPRLYCMTLGVLFKVIFPENISSLCT